MGESSPIRRVLMTADTVGGVWTYALDLAKALAPAGIEVALATMGEPASPAQARDAASIRNLELYESGYRLEWMSNPWVDVERAGDWLLALEDEVDPDAVHLNGFAHGALPWRKPHLVAGHSCVLSWWRSVKGTDAPVEWARYREAARAGLQSARVVVAPSRAMLAELQRYYGPLENTAVISNSRPLSGLRSPSKEPMVLAAGRVWDEAKNIPVLARAAESLQWPVYVAGETKHPDGGVVQLAGVQLLDRLAADELGRWYGRASVFCSPARYEPFGLSILEAALASCALVLGDIPSLRENWEGAAAFVHPDDHDELAATLNELAGNHDRRERFRAAAVERAAAFSPERMAESYLALYGQLVRSSVPAAVAGD